jgi:transcription elongation factor Elf1
VSRKLKDPSTRLKDRTGETCSKCDKGKYIETHLLDDANEVLHCSECGHEIDAFTRVKGTGPKKPAPLSKDRTGETCTNCGKGKYKVASLDDEIDGFLHCSKCGHRIDRYARKDEAVKTTGPKKPAPPLTVSDEELLSQGLCPCGSESFNGCGVTGCALYMRSLDQKAEALLCEVPGLRVDALQARIAEVMRSYSDEGYVTEFDAADMRGIAIDMAEWAWAKAFEVKAGK